MRTPDVLALLRENSPDIFACYRKSVSFHDLIEGQNLVLVHGSITLVGRLVEKITEKQSAVRLQVYRKYDMITQAKKFKPKQIKMRYIKSMRFYVKKNEQPQ